MNTFKPKFNISRGRLSMGVIDDKGRERLMISSLIHDMHGTGGDHNLLAFIDGVVQGTNKPNDDEHGGNGFAVKVEEIDGKKMLKIFFDLTDDYKPDYIDHKEFKELLEIWIKEKAKFDQDPKKYKEELKKKGGVVIEK